MAGAAPEGSQFDARQYDAKMSEIEDLDLMDKIFSPRMMRFMKVLMLWDCKKTFLGESMLWVELRERVSKRGIRVKSTSSLRSETRNIWGSLVLIPTMVPVVALRPPSTKIAIRSVQLKQD